MRGNLVTLRCIASKCLSVVEIKLFLQYGIPSLLHFFAKHVGSEIIKLRTILLVGVC